MPRYSEVSRTHHYVLLSVLIGLPIALLVYLGINQSRAFQIETGERLESAARVAAQRINGHLLDLTEHLWSIVSMPAIVDAASDGSSVPYDAGQVARLDAEWRAGNPDPRLLETPASSYLQRLIDGNGTLHELLFTDSLGRLVGANDTTSDYDQADECWFLEWFERPETTAPGNRRVDCGFVGRPDRSSCDTSPCASIGDVLLDESADHIGFEISGPIMASGTAWGAYKALVDPLQLQNYLDAVESTGLAEAYLVAVEWNPIRLEDPDTMSVSDDDLIQYVWSTVNMPELLRAARAKSRSDLPAESQAGEADSVPVDASISTYLRRLIEQNNLLHELVVTDSLGRLLGASHATSDHDRSDECWFLAWFEPPIGVGGDRRADCAFHGPPDPDSCGAGACASVGTVRLGQSSNRTVFEISGPMVASDTAWGAYRAVVDSLRLEERWRVVRSGRRDDGASEEGGSDFAFVPRFAPRDTAEVPARCPKRPWRPRGEQHEFCYVDTGADGASRVIGASRGRIDLAASDWYVALVDSDEFLRGRFGARLWYLFGSAVLLGFLFSSIVFGLRQRRDPIEDQPPPSA